MSSRPGLAPSLPKEWQDRPARPRPALLPRRHDPRRMLRLLIGVAIFGAFHVGLLIGFVAGRL